MIGAYIMGLLADRFSPKRVLAGIVAGWIVVLILFAANSLKIVFWFLGPAVGIFLGGVWAVSRPLLVQLAPPNKLGEFFGLFSLSGRAAAICGPLVWGGVVLLLSPDQPLGRFVASAFGLGTEAAAKLPYRCAVLALAAMMAFGLYIFRKVPDRKRA
jgi:MFS transporter, UMF1 family